MDTKRIPLTIGLNLKEFFLLVFLICAAGFSTIIQLITLFVFSFIYLFIGHKIKFVSRWIFYVSLLIVSVLQLFLVWKTEYGINFIVNTLLISAMWFFALQSSNFVVKSIYEIDKQQIEKILKIFFKLNLLFALMQILHMCIEMKTLTPFSSMSAGDNVKGLFRNSSVNMIIMSFFAVFYITKKDFKYAFLSFLIMVLTFYMSGLVLFIGVLLMYAFFSFSFKNKIKVVAGILIGLILFTQFSPKNVEYVKHIIIDRVLDDKDPARKIVSFKQTFNYWISNPINFIFGSGGGKFSSRTAFISAGEYVNWFPEKYVFISQEFNKNHFPLWNKETLSIPYNDGTSNQPFSFYNKIIGEYGLFGLLLFITYLLIPLKHYRNLTYGRLIFPLIFVYFLLDYWFEYFSVIVFFELFLFSDIKNSHDEFA